MRLREDSGALNTFPASAPLPGTLEEPWAIAWGHPTPRVLLGAGPSAPRGGAAFGGPRPPPASAEVPAMGAAIGCATRRSGRPRPAGPGY